MSGMNASESSGQFGVDHVVVMARLSDVDTQKEIAQPCIGKCAAVHRELSRFCKVGLAANPGTRPRSYVVSGGRFGEGPAREGGMMTVPLDVRNNISSMDAGAPHGPRLPEGSISAGTSSPSTPTWRISRRSCRSRGAIPSRARETRGEIQARG